MVTRLANLAVRRRLTLRSLGPTPLAVAVLAMALGLVSPNPLCLAASMVGLGDILKKVGIGLGIVLALMALSAAGNQFGGGAIAFFGLLEAGAVAGGVWTWGNSVAAQGQMLRATLDAAVAASPFLTVHEQALAMGLAPTVVRM